MPDAKNGKAGSAVEPAEPAEAEEADQANPGEVEKVKAEQRQTKTGKYGSTPTKPFKPGVNGEDPEKKKSWIEMELVDERNHPVPGQRYRVTLPDGETVAEGTLNEKGFARVDGIDPGTCRITFPDLDREAWKEA